MIITFLITGIIAGLIAGLFGTGSSMIVLPVLIYYLPHVINNPNIVNHTAAGTTMGIITIGAISAAIAQRKHSHIRKDIVLLMTPSLIIGALIGAYISHLLPKDVLKIYIGVVVFLTALYTLFKPHNEKTVDINNVKLIIASLIVSIVCSIAGVAMGILLIPLLLHWKLNSKEAISTSLAAAVLYTIAASIMFIIAGQSSTPFTLGYIYFPAFIYIAVMIAIIAPFAVKLRSKVPNKLLKKIFAIYILLAGIYLILDAFL